METKNEKKETVASTVVRPTIYEVIGENYFDDEFLEETIDLNGNKKRSLL